MLGIEKTVVSNTDIVSVYSLVKGKHILNKEVHR